MLLAVSYPLSSPVDALCSQSSLLPSLPTHQLPEPLGCPPLQPRRQPRDVLGGQRAQQQQRLGDAGGQGPVRKGRWRGVDRQTRRGQKFNLIRRVRHAAGMGDSVGCPRPPRQCKEHKALVALDVPPFPPDLGSPPQGLTAQLSCAAPPPRMPSTCAAACEAAHQRPRRLHPGRPPHSTHVPSCPA